MIRFSRWQQHEKYLEENFGFKRTVASGSVHGNCDLYKKIGDITVRIEAKFTSKKYLTFHKKDYYKGLSQTHPTEIFVLSYANHRTISFFIPNDISLPHCLFPKTEIHFPGKNLKSFRFEVNEENCPVEFYFEEKDGLEPKVLLLDENYFTIFLNKLPY